MLVQNVLGLPVKPSEADKRIARLERQLARAKDKARQGGKATRDLARIQRELDEARAALDEALAESARVRAECGRSCGCQHAPQPKSDSAVRVVDAAVTALLTRPPAGVDAAYVADFARRHRGHLVALVRARLGAGASP